MGNCLFGGLGDDDYKTDDDDLDGNLIIKVIKSDGEILKFDSPITAGSISDDFSGHAIFSDRDLLFKPLPNDHHLLPGKSYYLLPINSDEKLETRISENRHTRSNSESIRMSLDYNHGRILKRSYTDVLSRNIHTMMKKKKTRKRSKSSGLIWKVKLVIETEELLKILSEDGRTNELIENVRAAANGGNVVVSSGSSEIDSLSVVHDV